MTAVELSTVPYTIISADCHAGGSHETYRGYLEPRTSTTSTRGESSTATRSGTCRRRPRPQLGQRASQRRARGRRHRRRGHLPEHRAAVLPDWRCSPGRPSPDDFEPRLAGIRAHNRWLADWCADYPDRRAGIGQIFLNDVDDAIADVRWIKEHGLRGGDPCRRCRRRHARHRTALLAALRPALGGVRGARHPGQQPLRQRTARLRQVPGVAGGLAHETASSPTARCRTC